MASYSNLFITDTQYLIGIQKSFDQLCKNTATNNWIRDYMEHRIPEDIPVKHTKYPTLDFNMLTSSSIRSLAIQFCGFALVTEALLNGLVKDMENYTDKPADKINVLEVGCGLGTLACGLRKHGVNVIAVDNFKRFAFGSSFSVDNAWIDDIINMDQVDAVEKYCSDVDFIIASWPECNNDITRVLTTMRTINPKTRMIYCGEGYGGCTATDEFFEVVGDISITSMKNTNNSYRKWYNMYDFWVMIK